jgi:hypothetical protein
MESCTCGFYAATSLRGAVQVASFFIRTSSAQAGRPWTQDQRIGVVLGRVELAGKVIEHDRGYRAERARIVELIPVRGSEMFVANIGRRLNVMVGAPVKVPSGNVATRLPPAPRSPRNRKIRRADASEPRDWSPIWALVVALLWVLGRLALDVARP